MAFSDKIKDLRLARGLTQAEIANGIQLPNNKKLSPSSIGMYEQGRRKPSFEVLESFADFFNVDLNTLTGAQKSCYTDSKAAEYVHTIFNYDHFPVGISAGQLQTVDPLMEIPKLPLPDIFMGKYARNKNVCIMHVYGESMNNVIADGAMIAVQRNLPLEQIKNGDIVVAKNNSGEYTIKRFFYLPEDKLVILRPDSSNLAFSDIRVHIDDVVSLNIFGKVVIYNVIL